MPPRDEPKAPHLAATAAAAPFPPCTLCDFLWEEFAGEADRALERGAPAEAETCWRTADSLTLGFAPADPRRAASLTALGAMRALQGDRAGAEDLLRRALEQWRRAPEWIAGMEVQLKARSSLFHFRLESRHRPELVRFARVQNEQLAAAGRAAALGNLAALLAQQGREEEAARLYAEAVADRAKGLSRREEGVGWLSAGQARLLARAGRAAEADEARARAQAIARDPVPAGWRRFGARTWPRMSDERRLMAAVELAPLLRAEALSAAGEAG